MHGVWVAPMCLGSDKAPEGLQEARLDFDGPLTRFFLPLEPWSKGLMSDWNGCGRNNGDRQDACPTDDGRFALRILPADCIHRAGFITFHLRRKTYGNVLVVSSCEAVE